MSKKLSRSWFVAIIIVAGFALASCGGGGDSSKTTSLKKALADSEAENVTQQEALDKALADSEAAKLKLAMEIERAFNFSLSVYKVAIIDYNTEASEYDEKDVVAYDAEADDNAVDNLLDLAQKAAVAAANAAAAAGTSGQMATAQLAVTAAAAAVSEATNEINQAIRTADSGPYMDALPPLIDSNTLPIIIDKTGTKLTDDGVTVAVTSAVTRGTGVYKGAASASDVGDGWYRADAVGVEVEVGDDDELIPIKGTATVVYTDIEAAFALFSVVHNAETRVGISPGAVEGVLNLVTSNTNEVLAELNMYVMADAFPGSGRGSTTITYVTGTDGMTSDNPRKFDGTFDGVGGKYRCEGEDICSATAGADGEFTGFAGMWTFTPDYLGADGKADADDAAVGDGDDLDEDSVAVGDPDYLSFGWWTQVEDNSVTFQNFADGNQPFTGADDSFTSEDISVLTGTATYTGPAAGVYLMNRFNPNGTLDSIGQGEFTANAKLTATFEDDPVNNKITGKVTNFMSGSDDSLGNWNLELREATFGTMATFNNESVLGGLGGFPVESGKWDGEFFGNPDPDDPNDPDSVDNTDDYPNSVAGKFDAHSANVDVAGAFGAKR